MGLWEIGVHRREAHPAKLSARGVSGRVITPEGEPARGVEVIVVPEGPVARSDDQGRFELPVDDGTAVRVEAHHSDLGFAGAEAHSPASAIELRLAPRAGVRVRVVSGGRPVEGAIVSVRTLLQPPAVLQADRGTDADGMLRFVGLPPGRLLVEAQIEASGVRAVTAIEATEGVVTETTVTLPAVAPGSPPDGARQGSSR